MAELDYKALFVDLFDQLGLFFEEKRDDQKWVELRERFVVYALIYHRNSLESSFAKINQKYVNPYTEILAEKGVTDFELNYEPIFYKLFNEVKDTYDKEKDHLLWRLIIEEFVENLEKGENENRN